MGFAMQQRSYFGFLLSTSACFYMVISCFYLVLLFKDKDRIFLKPITCTLLFYNYHWFHLKLPGLLFCYGNLFLLFLFVKVRT